jgi:hypothetical protein
MAPLTRAVEASSPTRATGGPHTVDKAVELFAWAQRTRATSRRLSCEATELRETAAEISDSVHRPHE